MTRALIVIDVQESFRRHPGWATISNPGIVGQVNQLVDAAGANGDLVIWVLHAEAGTGTVFDPGSAVRPRPGSVADLAGVAADEMAGAAAGEMAGAAADEIAGAAAGEMGGGRRRDGGAWPTAERPSSRTRREQGWLPAAGLPASPTRPGCRA